MLNSNERMGFIIEYMSSYDEKIKMANKNGLFDAAKMFELFAIEVCNVWFGQKFSNLNDETATYPYVDLISENRELLVQVSTVQDVPTKIKTTLEKIRDSKDKKCSDLKNIVFFVLSNNSIDKVREYSGDNQIGSISFTIKDNLITTNDIITKAQNDLNFQKKLYKVLKDEYENFNINIRKFKGALELSNSGLKNIEGLINGEYEIDRNEFLEKITKDNERYISIQGGAGSGKSVLCKKYVENEKLVLYARAERFLEESHIDDIWGCCIQDVLECINGKKLIFFIDALEFIADCAETKFELLQYLYDMAAEYQNVYIVTSCRTSDKNAFIKLETNFSIKIYEVGDITEDELALLMKQYPIIHKMYKTNSYVDLLKSPFYINLIVSNSMDIDNIGDENSLREYIWKNIICLEEKSRMYGILSNKVIETVEKIVFERARKFMLGIHKDDIDRDIMHALLSEGVIAQQGDYIRLKYDIFEDICFEHYFDKAFDLCKGKYKTFYDEIENLGRCVYRRYQIWISNKMFIQVNRDKENFIWGMQCLEVKIGDDMCVKLVAHRLTSLALKKQMKFEKRKLQDFPQYEFSYNNNTLKRVSNENKDRRENFIIKPVDGERGSITFFDFTDYETFSCTKMGVLYDILNALHDEFGKYIRVKFKQYSIDEVLEYKRASLELYKDIVKKEVLNSGINIVDVVHSETSEDYLQDVADGINKIIPEAKCSVGKRLSKKKLNVRYIHDKSFYSDSEVDPHQESMEDYVVQHITVENFKHQSSAAVYNILKELVIKKDIATGKITLVDWSQYGYKADWLFGVVVDGTYYFMTIHPDGSFKIEALKRNLFTMTEYDKYMDYFGLNEENKNDYRGVIGLVKDAEGNINLIKDTNMYSMPDYTAMGDVLKNVASEGRFPGKDVVTWLRLVMDTTDKIKVHAELDIVIPHIDVNAEYTKANVMGLFKGITTKKEVVRYVFENTGIMLYAYLRGEEERREYLSGNIDINYFDYDDTHAKYSVGEIGNGMKYTIERASVVREIQAVEGSKLVFKKVLPLMGVEFVRYGMLTVVPFPFKYLREYIVKEDLCD